ncbi:hypothetical protein GQR58_028271 [Nymphon striatum]|nr:hypothetical protein GQR58_028271 [Nymphon striatum]
MTLLMKSLVDSLFLQDTYGEKWASWWLDYARYADSKGYEKDMGRSIWKYRDWLINAFNKDMPYDQFTIEQLAGDLLPEPSTDQLIATAFHRNTMNNDEGGTDDEEYRVATVIDRLNTTFEVWQSTTIGCVQCHSHPYDPFKHEDVYDDHASVVFWDDGNLVAENAYTNNASYVYLNYRSHYNNTKMTIREIIHKLLSIRRLKRCRLWPENPEYMKRTTQLFDRGSWLMKTDTVLPDDS